jgi:hypothetical protein
MANLTPAQQAQVEKVRKQMASNILDVFYPDKDELNKLDGSELIILNLQCFKSADFIISLEGLAILDSEQTGVVEVVRDEQSNSYVLNIQPNFKKVIPKGDK